MRSLPTLPLLCICLWLATVPCHAHKVTAVSVITSIETEPNTWTVELAMNIDPSDDPTVNDEVSPVDAATDYAANGIEVWADDTQLTFSDPEIAIEELSDPDTPEELKRRQVIAKISGTFEEGAREFTLRANEAFTPAIILLAIIDGKQERRTQSIFPGESSRPLRLEPITPGDPFQAEPTVPPVAAPTSEPASPVPAPSSMFVSGFKAVWADHWLTALFVLGFLFPSITKRIVFRQLIGFAIACSLGLSIPLLLDLNLGGAPMASVIVALSLILLGGAILSTKKLTGLRVALVSLFGFAHGAALSEGLYTKDLTQLTLFNVGVTAAIVVALVVGVALCLITRSRSSIRRFVSPLVAAALIAGGLFALLS